MKTSGSPAKIYLYPRSYSILVTFNFATGGEDYVDRPYGDRGSLVRMEPQQQVAECIIEILQDSKREDIETLDVLLSTPTSNDTLIEASLHPSSFTTIIVILDDEGVYIIMVIIIIIIIIVVIVVMIIIIVVIISYRSMYLAERSICIYFMYLCIAF